MVAFLLLLLLVSPVLAQVTPTDPTEPTAFTPSFAASALSTVNVTSGDGADLKSKIEAITTCGVEVVIPVASGYAPSSEITLPAVAGDCLGSGGSGVSAIAGSSGVHAVSGSSGVSTTTSTGGDNYITIRSAESDQITAYGGRVVTADKTHMPTITIPNAGRLFNCQIGTHHIRIVGLNMVANSGQWIDGFLLCQVPEATTTGTDMHHIVMDRNYGTGDSTAGAVNGIGFGGQNMAAIGNRITNVLADNISETHAMLMSTGTGPYYIHNNELCADQIGIFIGDSQVDRWTGGSYGVGNPIVPADITITGNYVHQLCVPSDQHLSSKNLFEIKHGQRVKVDGNVFDTSYVGGQDQAINLVSYRGSQSRVTDIQFTNNWVKNMGAAINMTLRPSCAASGCAGAITSVTSDGTTNCGGSACATIVISGGDCVCTPGDTIELGSMAGSGGTWANLDGNWRITATSDRQHMTINGAFPGGTWSAGTFTIWHQSRPVSKVKITGNYFMDASSAVATGGGSSKCAIVLGTNPQFNPSGGTDAGISETGTWAPSHFNISHNTIHNPTASDTLQCFLQFTEPSFNPPYATIWKGDTWAIRDNVVRISNGGGGSYGVKYVYGIGGALGYGTLALNQASDSVTRDFSHNLGYVSGFGDESTKYTGSDSWITSSTGSCASVAVLVDCTATTIAGAALQASSAGHNASTTTTDVGIDATALAAALSGVEN